MKPILKTIILAVALPSSAVAAIQGSGGSATFDAAGPAGFRIQGKTPDISVSEGEGSVRVTVGLSTLDTGIDLRNHHMRDKYLEVQKYPNAILFVARAALQYPKDGQDAVATAHGTMTLHGQTHPVSFTYKAHGTRDGWDVTGSAHLNMTDYGIVVPGYLGIAVKPDVEVGVHFVARDL